MSREILISERLQVKKDRSPHRNPYDPFKDKEYVPNSLSFVDRRTEKKRRKEEEEKFYKTLEDSYNKSYGK